MTWTDGLYWDESILIAGVSAFITSVSAKPN